MEIKTGLRLLTKDGRVIGNAIVMAVRDNGQVAVETDHGNTRLFAGAGVVDSLFHRGEPCDIAEWRRAKIVKGLRIFGLKEIARGGNLEYADEMLRTEASRLRWEESNRKMMQMLTENRRKSRAGRKAMSERRMKVRAAKSASSPPRMGPIDDSHVDVAKIFKRISEKREKIS